ncbi:MAG TPA: transcription-repair coupling factor [Gaiellales bacterium]|nr:transcription-repair coupling factor [Gaiellales bacterium]
MDGLEQQVEGPLAGAELALAYLLGDESFAAYARRTAVGITRARVSEPILPALVAALWHSREGLDPRALAVVCADDDAARALAESAAAFLPPDTAAFLPSRGVGWGSGLDPAPHLVGERHRALDALARGGLVAVSADALIERVDPPGRRPAPVELRLGEELPFDELVSSLADAGYERADSVEERGQFSVRGGLVDVFPTTGREPVRIEFFGDQIERLSAFSAFTQRSLRDLDQVLIHPAAEAGRDLEHTTWGRDEDEAGAEVPDGLVPLGPELVAGAAVLAWNPADLAAAVEGAHAEVAEWLRDPAARGRGYVQPEAVADLLESVPALEAMPLGQPFQFEAQLPALASTGIAEAENELRALVRAGYRVLVCFAHLGEARRTHMSLRRIEATVPAPGGHGPDEAGVAFVVSPLRHGFVSPGLRVAVLPAAQLLRRRGARGPARFGGRALSTVADLRSGDYVVHEDHGVGRFIRFDTKEVGGVVRDYLYLEFRGDDRLYVPHDQLAKVSRYVGADGRAPALARLGGKAWSTLKSRARVAVRELAGELLALYARRQTATRPAVGADDEWMARLEASFPFDETDDQEVAIDAVKQDLEAPQPMDRLVCGDVGFGKTEVAVRAAFKVASAGRQVLMLVPTTILAQQHAATLRERFRDFPVRVEMVSRFRAPAEVKQVLAEFAAGKVDVLVGTHRVLSRDVVPQNLGLVVLDEEQRFGVAQKELLRQLRLEVDVLAMSATPIPRTLHMSLSGLRDISVITTPPRGRHPIKTHVGEFDEELIAAALRREHARGGQSFYLHNRVETIDDVAERVRRWVPELRVGVAHGQMAERALEGVMMQFLRGEFDVLVSTTIIESGLDIPQANTLIVERADTLGLAQLYQIRGRVGRSEEVAHAFLFYPDRRELSEEARHRLSTLADYTELGSGYRIAMRDLELRGAGNLLGDEQSGHVAAVGFELYCELLAEAVAELQGAPPAAAKPVRVEAQVDAYVPADYVPLEAVKIDVHRRVALAVDRSELREIEAELADRFGPLPEPVSNLLAIQELRLVAADMGMAVATLRGGTFSVGPVALGSAEVRALRDRFPAVRYTVATRELSLRPAVEPPATRPGVHQGLELLDAILDIRREIAA